MTSLGEAFTDPHQHSMHSSYYQTLTRGPAPYYGGEMGGYNQGIIRSGPMPLGMPAEQSSSGSGDVWSTNEEVAQIHRSLVEHRVKSGIPMSDDSVRMNYDPATVASELSREHLPKESTKLAQTGWGGMGQGWWTPEQWKLGSSSNPDGRGMGPGMDIQQRGGGSVSLSPVNGSGNGFDWVFWLVVFLVVIWAISYAYQLGQQHAIQQQELMQKLMVLLTKLEV